MVSPLTALFPCATRCAGGIIDRHGGCKERALPDVQRDGPTRRSRPAFRDLIYDDRVAAHRGLLHHRGARGCVSSSARVPRNTASPIRAAAKRPELTFSCPPQIDQESGFDPMLLSRAGPEDRPVHPRTLGRSGDAILDGDGVATPYNPVKPSTPKRD